MRPNLNNVRHTAQTRLLNDLRNSSEELYILLNKIIENSDYLSIKAKKPIKNIDDLIDLIENSDIFELERMLS